MKQRRNNNQSHQIVGYMMYLTAVIMPLTTAPQILQLYTTRVSTGLSLAMWMMYLVFGLVPLVYGIVNRLRPIVITNLLWTAVDLIMIAGIIKYAPHAAQSDFDRLLLMNNIGKTISGLGLICISTALGLFAFDLIGVGHAKSKAK
jgi:uncharacterized protein with PQ loop repeat